MGPLVIRSSGFGLPYQLVVPTQKKFGNSDSDFIAVHTAEEKQQIFLTYILIRNFWEFL